MDCYICNRTNLEECFMCHSALGTVYITRQGKRFCDAECSAIYAEMHPMVVKTNGQGRRGERGPRKVSGR
jgi:hypothetical protein